VLPPIDTSDWQAKTIDKHVADVRNQFLKALHQKSELTPKQDQSGTSDGQQAPIEDQHDPADERWKNVVLGSWE
jgi:putative phosphoserine phosphatase/1-acylglycerol-3-phosphate O-acyltransferase